MARKLYRRFKLLLPERLRDAFSAVNQRLFARRKIGRKYGSWFDVDWRKHFRDLSDEEWKKAYDEAWRHRGNECVEETDAELIVEALGEPGSVLDVGSGSGALAIRLAQKGFDVWGVDVSAEAIRQARKRVEDAGVSVRLSEGFAERLPFENKKFDYVTCCHTLEHVRDLQAAVDELKRVARKVLVVLVPKQKRKTYLENYHTQFFWKSDDLTSAVNLPATTIREIDCTDHRNEFQGTAFLLVARLPSR